MKKIFLFTVASFFLGNIAMAQNNVGIGTNLPDPSAKLDVKATDKGLLIPNVSLTAKNVAAPITSPAISLLVYNTNTSGAAPNNVYPGYYYWDGTIWVRLHSSDNDWTKSSTVSTPAIKTDNQYITGNAGIGDFSTADPLKSLHIKHSANTGGLLLQNTTGGAGSTTNISLYTC